MKFLLDNNLPPALAKALNELSKIDNHQVVGLKEKFAPNTSDIELVQQLKTEGNWVLVSKDKFSKGNMEKRAIRESELAVFILARQWQNAPYWDVAHNLVRWWPAITGQAERISGGGVFKVAWRYSPPGKFEVLQV
ncbi:hypothetical protein CNQ84_14585 [Pseudomonas abyssi]|uniref:VapC45 PIN like domain-containing protein n=1 Tax=Pseudomonas abyssi TaxID=170540 RepID=A0A2A3MFA9_9PSED|nr:DUF5615 family PIN-like protein [Pseudomonas abyssi]MAC99133.1 hypothetical protein [Pseudomonadales bacterium]PBK03488.1 hypothetical protein CNQ84_14585 [Pseudomonas abyssi]